MRESLRLFRFNIKSILIFQVIYKLASLALLSPFIYWMFNMSIKMADISILSTLTIKHYFRTPTTYLMLLIILVIMAMYSFIDISAMLFAMEASYRRRKISITTMFLKGIGNSLRVLRVKNIPMIFYLLFILPLTNSISISGTVIGIKIPEFIMSYIRQNKVLFMLLIFMYLLLSIFAMMRIFSIMFFTLQDKNYNEAKELSIKSIKKGSNRKIVIGIIFWNAIITISVYLLEGTISGIIGSFLKSIIHNQSAYFVVNSFMRVIILFFFAISIIVVTPLIYAYICNSYYKVVGDVNFNSREYMKLKNSSDLKKQYLWSEERVKRKEKIIFSTVLIVALLLNACYVLLSVTGILDVDMFFNQKVKIAAHRGESRNAPENTLAAFQLAIDGQADVIELDVRQTKDGVIVVLHDENINRVCGVNKKIGDITYEELCQYSAGEWFGEEFEDERVPTLVEAIELTNGVIDLNIELKPSKSDINLEEEVVKIIQEYDLYDSCVVASLDYNAIKKTKILDDKIKTVYVMSMAYGNFEEFEYADVFSIRYGFVSAEMVKNIHGQGKEVYAWTVNNKDRIKDLMQKNVDCIITDMPYTMKKIVYEESDGMMINWIEGFLGEF